MSLPSLETGSPRWKILNRVTDVILTHQLPHPTRVAVDGIDAAGKSIFGDELAASISSRGIPVIRSSIDHFHYPRQQRHQRYGSDSPLGYYEDSFNYPQVRTVLLDPLGPGGNRVHRTAAFDFETDSVVESAVETAPENAILVFDGIFLMRKELLDCWDIKIYLDIPFEVSVQRASQRQRDQNLFGEVDQVAGRYWKRYVPGQKIYFEQCQPKEHADIVIGNRDLNNPQIIYMRFGENR